MNSYLTPTRLFKYQWKSGLQLWRRAVYNANVLKHYSTRDEHLYFRWLHRL